MDKNISPVWISNDHSVRHYQRGSPVRLTFCGNFTPSCKLFDISEKRASMRRDILNTVLKRTESQVAKNSDNPLYEDPRDIIGEKPQKPLRKRTAQAIAMLSPRSKDKTTLKEQKRKLAKKYEGLIMTLMERCEENVVLITEKNSHITKLKEKLKTVLEFNKQFAEENDLLKEQYSAIVKYLDECKSVIKEEREKNRAIEERRKVLEDKIKEFHVPDRDHTDVSTTIPLVEVCMNCSSRQILLNQAKEHNQRLQKDMQALKDVLYRLNVQLSRYQEKMRANIQSDTTEPVYRFDKYDGYDSLITASLGVKQDATRNEDRSSKGGVDDHTRYTKVVDVTGLLSAQALAPLFDAYQENLQEKDNLITDYEKQFENMNKKSKQIVEESKSLNEKVTFLEEELMQVRQSHKKLLVEKDTADIEKASLVERAERAENKLKEVYELYEDKMSALARDYETVHREYFTVKSALDASAGRSAALEALRARTVPADLHERRLDHCKRLLEELKHQYSMEDERRTDKLNKAELQLKVVEEKYNHLCQEHEIVKGELNAALKNVRLYRKAAVIFRQRLKAASARATRVRRSARLKRGTAEPLKQALDKLERIKHEIKAVKCRAYSSLEELERRIVEQERRASLAQRDHRRELQRAHLALQHKEAVIRSLMDKVADVEEVRLSQTNAHRLQGIVSDSDKSENDAADRHNDKLLQGSGGYYKDKKKICKT